MPKSLRIEHVSHSFGLIEILQDISFNVSTGQIIALVGPSGCGKTTLLRLCAGLLELLEGEINSDFETPAYMFQQPNLLPWKNTLDNIAIGLKARGVKRNERESKARELGLRMGLVADDMSKFPHELSGGMQQRAALARALVLQPDLFLLDEPFSALDIGLKSELYQLLVEQLTLRQASVLMITHDLMEAARLSDTIYLMNSEPGRIVQQYHFDTALKDRNDQWVYQTTAELMSNTDVLHCFGLLQKKNKNTP